MTIYTREMLGWPTAREMRLSPAICDAGMVLHWDGGTAKLTGKPHSKCVEYWQGVRVFHMKAVRLGGRGWRDIGYSYGVCPHGDEFAGRTYGYEQAAQPGGNTTWTSCTLMLGPGELPTDVQIEAVRNLRARLMSKGLHAHMRGHSQFISTDCPGPIIRALITNGTFTKPGTADDSWMETMISALPTLRLGDISFDVKSARGLIFQRGAVDGLTAVQVVEFLGKVEFDAQLFAFVKAFQTKKKLVSDGIIGPQTWLKLMRVEVK